MLVRISGTLILIAACALGTVSFFARIQGPDSKIDTGHLAEHTARGLTRSVLEHGPARWQTSFAIWEARRDAERDLSLSLYAIYVWWTDEWPRRTFGLLGRKQIRLLRVSDSDSPEVIRAYNSVMVAAIVEQYGCELPLPAEELEPYC